MALAALGLVAILVASSSEWKWKYTKGGEQTAETGPETLRPRPPVKEKPGAESAESGESAAASESAASAESSESAPESSESRPGESDAAPESGESRADEEPVAVEAEETSGPWYLPKRTRKALGVLKRARGTAQDGESEETAERGAEPSTPVKRDGAKETDEGSREREIPSALPLRSQTSDEPSVKLQTIVLALIEQSMVDARVTRAHIEEARRQITEGESTRARTSTFEAIRSAAFVRAGLPTVLARQCLDRAVIESEAGRTARAVDAIKAVKSIAHKLPLKCTSEGFTRWASQAIDALEDGDPALARDLVGQMMGVIGSSEAEDDLDRMGNALSSCLFAIDRDALKIAGAELDEANALVFDVIRITEGE